MKKLLIAAGGAVLLGLLSIRPYNCRKNEIRELFKNRYIAHRGFFREPVIPENSMAAFEKAAVKGYGIEMDLQLTRDGKLVVFHDDDLYRMCGVHRRVGDTDADELQELTLGKSRERIPLFEEVLDKVNGRVPLMVEIKPEGRFISAVKEAMRLLKAYNGRYCIESFNPIVLFWLKRHHPEVLRGQLSTDFKKDGDKHNKFIQFVLTNLMCNFLSRPDFISYNHKYSGHLAFQICRRLYRSVNSAWTIKNKRQLKNAEKDFELFIFDSFIPDAG